MLSLFSYLPHKKEKPMFIIEVLTAFGNLNLAPVAIAGAAGIMLSATALVYSERKKKTVKVTAE
jgi:hypothetical protein